MVGLPLKSFASPPITVISTKSVESETMKKISVGILAVASLPPRRRLCHRRPRRIGTTEGLMFRTCKKFEEIVQLDGGEERRTGI